MVNFNLILLLEGVTMDIREMVKGSKSKYEVSIISDAKRVVLGIVDVEAQQVDYNNEKYILIYDSNRRVIRDAYKYINLHLKDS